MGEEERAQRVVENAKEKEANKTEKKEGESATQGATVNVPLQ